MRVIFFGNGFDYSLSFLRVLVDHPDVSLVAMVSPARGGQRRHWGAMATTLAARLPEKIADGIAVDAHPLSGDRAEVDPGRWREDLLALHGQRSGAHR